MRWEEDLRGSLLIQVRSAAGERFFTLCARQGVVFRRVQALDADLFQAWISAGDFFALRRCAFRTSSRIRILRRRGLPFAAKKLTGRWMLMLGAALSAAAVLWLTGCVWTIRVDGCRETTQGEILQLLEQAGLKTGTRRAGLSVRELRNHVIGGCDKLSYLTINFRGTQALIQVWERKETPRSIPQEEPCDILSDKTGVILRLRVRQGTACVQVGDAIQPGDRIAEGRILGAAGELRKVHAMAEADLRTCYTIRTAIPAELQTFSVLEELRPERWLLFGSRRFPLQKIEKAPELWYDKQIETQLLQLQEEFRFPMGIETERRFRGTPDGQTPERDALPALLEERMLRRLLAAKPEAELCGHTFSLEKTDGGAYLGVLRAELIETCGVEAPAE